VLGRRDDQRWLLCLQAINDEIRNGADEECICLVKLHRMVMLITVGDRQASTSARLADVGCIP
jgi:hypothetical protein